MARDGESQTYVFGREAVNRAITVISSRRTHEHLPGYLAVMRAKRANENRPAALSDIVQFHDRYLRAEGGPDNMPFVSPFRSRGSGLIAFNANVAGSYAPSSIRARNKLTDVLAVDGARQYATYDLQPNHADAAFAGLLDGKRLLALALAAFLYRDYGLVLAKPRLSSVIGLFRDEFGLRNGVTAEAETFDRLFEDGWPGFSDADLEPSGTGGG